ncbi:hypothetical protein ACFY8V_18830 [Streptomyces californicus]|uniref:hypothetical protein n=1 Tax=Streptomyces californicus TaxID=67351 RepID=UPI0036E52D6F
MRFRRAILHRLRGPGAAGADRPRRPNNHWKDGAKRILAIDDNGDGREDLLARYDRPDVAGLCVFHGRGADEGLGIRLTDRIAIGSNWSVNTVPRFTAAPDANNNGKFDLWATTPGSGRLRFFADYTAAGHTTVSGISDAFLGYQSIG